MDIYLDWNIFDRIEKITQLQDSDRRTFESLEKIISNEKVSIPYSNAHLNDLLRGFKKNSYFIDKHLDTLEKLTNNLCICQYWNHEHVVWHNRSVKEFFKEKKEEIESEPETFLELVDFDETGILKSYIKAFELIPLPKQFYDCYKYDSLFGIIYPTSRKEKNMLALCNDLHAFSMRLKTDYSVYKSLRSFLVKSISKLNKKKDLLKQLKLSSVEAPEHLTIFELSKLIATKTESSKNKNYSRIIETFIKYDLKGYKSDANFNNLFDDALHTFYGAHCDYFITRDDRCHYKAIKTFEKLGIKTVVLKPEEFERII